MEILGRIRLGRRQQAYLDQRSAIGGGNRCGDHIRLVNLDLGPSLLGCGLTFDQWIWLILPERPPDGIGRTPQDQIKWE